MTSFSVRDLGKSSVDDLKQVFTQIAPDYLTTGDRGTTDKAKFSDYQVQGRQKKGPGMGQFIPAHLPGDTYVDKDRRKNLERVINSTCDFSHKAFVSANPPVDTRAKHGGWEGTFANRHGGYPHMFESTCPEKSKRWLGQVENKSGNTMPMLVKFPSKAGPGVPGRSIGGGDPTYECDFNYDKVEKLNRQMKLGAGSGFRSDKRPDARPWITTQVHPRGFDGMAPYQEVDQPPSSRPILSKAAQIASRPEHSAPFISATKSSTLPSETFGTLTYVPDGYIDNINAHFSKMVQEKLHRADMKRGIKPVVHPPFKVSGGIASKSTPSIMFRRSSQ